MTSFIGHKRQEDRAQMRESELESWINKRAPSVFWSAWRNYDRRRVWRHQGFCAPNSVSRPTPGQYSERRHAATPWRPELLETEHDGCKSTMRTWQVPDATRVIAFPKQEGLLKLMRFPPNSTVAIETRKTVMQSRKIHYTMYNRHP